ncbi:hypothetical protein BHM03_00002834 [Ensete ventricosum]|nr:hypothetical protein BHM03_00002834 [Ensete ventricosum]
MEGLIPMMIQAIKKSMERRAYQCISEGAAAPALTECWKLQQEESSHRSRSRSDRPISGADYLFPPEPLVGCREA